MGFQKVALESSPFGVLPLRLGGLLLACGLATQKLGERVQVLLALPIHWKRERGGGACVMPLWAPRLLNFRTLRGKGLTPSAYGLGPCLVLLLMCMLGMLACYSFFDWLKCHSLHVLMLSMHPYHVIDDHYP